MFVRTCLSPVWLLIVTVSVCSGLVRGASEQRQEQRFQEAAPNEGFGEATAISGDWAMIAAPWSSGNRGRVQVCRRQAGVWTASQVIESPNPQNQSLFGKKLTLSGDWLAISQPESAGSSDLIRGSVHLYHRSLEHWHWVQTLRGTQTDADFHRFGDGLDLDGGTLAVTDDVIRGFERSSSVRLFQLRGASWGLEQTLENVTTRLNQAAVLTLKLHGNVLALGNPWRLAKDGWNVGEVQIFRRQSGAAGRWKHEQTLLTDPKADAQRFGESVGFTDAGEMLATSSRSLWSSSWNGKLWSQPANVEINGNEAPLANASTNDMRVSGSVAAVFLNGLRLLRRTESGWQLMHTLQTGLVVPPLAVSADTVLFRSQWGYSTPEAVSFVPLMEIEVRLKPQATTIAGFGDKEVWPGKHVLWRPWIDGPALPLHIRNAGPSLLSFPTAQLSGTAAALFEIVGPTGAPALLAANSEVAFELRPRSSLSSDDLTLTVTFSTGGAVPDYAFQVQWASNLPQSFTAPQIALPPAVIHPKGQRLILTPSVNGSQAMTFRWLREGRTVPGQTRASMDLAALRPEDAGYYQLEVKSGIHTVISSKSELVVYEPQSGVIPMRDDQSARLTTKVWGRARIVWQDTQYYRDLAHPYIFGMNSPTLTVMSGRLIGSQQEELSAVAEVLASTGQSLASTVVARYSLRSVDRVPRIGYAFDQAREVGDNLSGEIAVYADNALDMDGLYVGGPGCTVQATGLPPGITIDTALGQLQGTLTKAGVYRVTWILTDFIGRKSAPFVSLIRVSQPQLPALPGTYGGIVSGSGVLAEFRLGGYLEILMEETGSFSGLLRVNADTRRFVGRLKPVPESSDKFEGELLLPTLTGAKTTRLILSSTPGQSAVSAQVNMALTDGGTETLGTTLGETLPFRARGATLAGPDLIGRYNTLLKADLIDGSTYPPQGSSYMSVMVTSGSTATAVGTLVDGTGFTCACPVLQGAGLLSLPLYFHAAGQGSTLAGVIVLDSNGSLNIGADLQWRQIAKPAARLYPEGFIMSLRSTAGGRYLMPPAGYTLLANVPDAPGNATILCVDPTNLFDPTPFRLTTDHRALLPPAPGRNRVSRVDFYAPTGFFTGEIILEASTSEEGKRIPGRKVGFRGMMIPHQNVGGGFYHLPGNPAYEGPFVSRDISIWSSQY